jgi:ATP-binding protein involved in chromosome partitioning
MILPLFSMDKEILLGALEKVKYPGFSRDIVSFGLVREASCENGVAVVTLELTSSDSTVPAQLKRETEEALSRSERGGQEKQRFELEPIPKDRRK